MKTSIPHNWTVVLIGDQAPFWYYRTTPKKVINAQAGTVGLFAGCRTREQRVVPVQETGVKSYGQALLVALSKS